MDVKVQQLRVVNYPHPALRVKARPIADVTDEVRAVADRMIELMHEARGVGLAAPQVALDWRLFVANPTGEPGDNRVYINPVLCDHADETAPREEGCLSIPGVYGQIMRPTGVALNALDRNGEPITDTSSDLIARIWQHEADHLDGVLILDRMSAPDKAANRRQIKALEKEFQALRA